jgi:hypothetical protein
MEEAQMPNPMHMPARKRSLRDAVTSECDMCTGICRIGSCAQGPIECPRCRGTGRAPNGLGVEILTLIGTHLKPIVGELVRELAAK